MSLSSSTLPYARASVRYIDVAVAYGGQRIDNFLFREYRHTPKSHIYRVIRSGELRVNSRRVKPMYKLSVGDRIRVPPIAHAISAVPCLSAVDVAAIVQRIVYENDDLLVVDKPAHLAVHTGTAHSFGLVDLLKYQYPENDIALAHRLDKGTSGCLLVAKSRPALLSLQKLFQDAQIEKSYQALVIGRWQEAHRVAVPLRRRRQGQTVTAAGRRAVSDFSNICSFADCSLMAVALMTGRTHQIRVHAAHCGHPVVGDTQYGNFAVNRRFARLGLKRLFLHAQRVSFVWGGRTLSFDIPLPAELQRVIDQLADV